MSHYDEETRLVKVSWSKIRTSEECKQKSYLTSEGMKSPVTDVRVFFQGNVVDQAMRRWLSMDPPPPGWMVAHVVMIMDEIERQVIEEGDGVVRWKHRQDRENVRAFCTVCADRLEKFLTKFVLPYEYQPAVRFKTPMMISPLTAGGPPVKILLNGEMDLLVREPSTGHYGVWDLKVTKDDQYWRKTKAQLAFYDVTCECMFGQPLTLAGLIQPMVESQQFMSWQPTEHDRAEMHTRIERTAHDILRQDYSPKADSTGCGYCEVRHACVKYAPAPGTSNSVRLF